MPETSTAPQPVLTLFYGDDSFSMEEELQSLLASIPGDAGMVEMNTTRLSDRDASLDALKTAGYSLPFLAERRLVIANNPQEGFKAKEARSQWTAFLDHLPDSTHLVITIGDTYENKARGWKVMDHTGAFLREWAEQNPDRARINVFRILAAYQMTEWIQKRAKKLGGRFEPQAAAALAELTGPEPGIADQEISKLLAYVNYKRPVELEDVQEAASAGSIQANVFDMADSIGMGKSGLALRQLNTLLENTDPQNLFGMIVRQFRLLILAREQMDHAHLDGKSLAAKISVHPLVAEKLLVQGQRYSLPKLEVIYHRLGDMDKAIKTGQIDAVVALQTFIADQTN